jgi:hypothetical protein
MRTVANRTTTSSTAYLRHATSLLGPDIVANGILFETMSPGMYDIDSDTLRTLNSRWISVNLVESIGGIDSFRMSKV